LAERFAVCALPPRHLGGPSGGRETLQVVAKQSRDESPG
jgi:hypothetical protein